MTILELNALPYITANIERILRHLESDNTDPEWFVPQEAKRAVADPMRAVLQQELPGLMAEYRRLMAYIDGIPDPQMKRIFEMRFIEQKPMREIGVQHGLTSNTVKKQIYDYVRFNPEGFCSCKELAARLGLHYETVRKWCVKGRILGAVKQGRRKWLIPLNAELPRSRRRSKE